MNNKDRVMKVYTDAGFNIDRHTFKSVGKNQVRVTIRTHARIYKNSRYTIDLFCDPLIRAGFKIVCCTTKSEARPNIIVFGNLVDPVRDAEIQDQRIKDYLRPKGMLSILIDVPVISTESIREQYKHAYAIVKHCGDFQTYHTLCASYGIGRVVRGHAFNSFYWSEY